MNTPEIQLDFGSENTSPVHPAFVAAVTAANVGFATNFEAEPWTERALKSLREFFEHDHLEVFACLPDSVVDALVTCGCRFQRDWRHEPRHHRFVCSWGDNR